MTITAQYFRIIPKYQSSLGLDSGGKLQKKKESTINHEKILFSDLQYYSHTSRHCQVCLVLEFDILLVWGDC